MKVVLLQAVKNIGDAGTVKEVANGYARNYLLPRKIAVPATADALRRIEVIKEVDTKRVTKLAEENKGIAERVDGQIVHIQARVGEQGRLYGSVTANDIATTLSSKIGQTVDKRALELNDNIRQIGAYDITVRLPGNLVSRIKVVVTPEGKPLPAEYTTVAPVRAEAEAAKTEEAPAEAATDAAEPATEENL